MVEHVVTSSSSTKQKDIEVTKYIYNRCKIKMK
jgi:hypothetical protein